MKFSFMAEFSSVDASTPLIFAFQSTQREMVEKDRAVALLAEVADIVDPTSAVLSNKSFSEEAAALVGDRLGQFSSLTILDISDVIAGSTNQSNIEYWHA